MNKRKGVVMETWRTRGEGLGQWKEVIGTRV